MNNIPKNIRLSGGRVLDFSKPLIMGVLNVTPDSFSDGGRYRNPDDAVRQARRMIDEKADIIDIGGESTRPGAERVGPEEERRRVIPVIKAIRVFSDIPLSIDTTRSDIARCSVEAGADIINDVSALRFDPEMASVAAALDTPVVLMHMLGTPKNMQNDPHYEDCIGEIKEFFDARIAYCVQNGIRKDRIIIDPGIGFGKRIQDNLEIINRLDAFKALGCPVMVGVSRKSFISMITGVRDEASRRIGGSLAAALVAMERGCNIFRVHDVRETVEALMVADAVKKVS
jgi:dihydropteroate synthase